MEISTPVLFCPSCNFEGSVIALLNKHLFNTPIKNLHNSSSVINSLADIYSDMRIHVNCPDIDRKYMIDGRCIKVNTSDLKEKSYISAGHDLPIWLSNNDDLLDVNCKVMIIGRDSGRQPRDMHGMKAVQDQITIYSPFGMHSRYHRRLTIAIPTIVNSLFDSAVKCDKKLSVYITDFYKFRKAEPAKIDSQNISTYQAALMDEINLYKPHLILLLGKEVYKMVSSILNTPNNPGYFNQVAFNIPPCHVVLIPHPSGSNNAEIIKAKKERHKSKRKSTIKFFVEEIENLLKDTCCKSK